MVSFDDITAENYVEYQTMPSGAWHAAQFAWEAVSGLASIASGLLWWFCRCAVNMMLLVYASSVMSH